MNSFRRFASRSHSMSSEMLSPRPCPMPCRLAFPRLSRSSSMGITTRPSVKSAGWTTSTHQKTPIRTIVEVSRREKDLIAIQESSGLISDKEKYILAKKEAKRAKWIARMQKEYGENWEATLEQVEHQRRHAAAREEAKGSEGDDGDGAEAPVKKKKQRWTQQQKDEGAARRLERKAARDAKNLKERGCL